MSLYKWLCVIAISSISNRVFSQQLVLGKNPYLLNKSAVLELNADNQGLLLPRITDTAAINTLLPPDGMLIYFVPSKQLLLRSNGYWKALASAGNYITGLTGDVTATGPGTVAATISNGAVTYPKMQNVSANNRLLGRATSGAGTVEEISLGSGLSMSGTTLNIGTVSIAQGGTGQTTGNAGAILSTDGTNTSWITLAGVSTANYLFAYSTIAQSVTTAGTWQDVTFSGGHPQLNGWGHSLTTNSQNFTCPQTGVYQVTFSAHIKNNDSRNPHEMDIRAVINGVEVQGSVYSMDCYISAPNLSGTFLASCNAGDILKLQMTGDSNQMQLVGSTYGTTKPTVTINITRIK